MPSPAQMLQLHVAVDTSASQMHTWKQLSHPAGLTGLLTNADIPFAYTNPTQTAGLSEFTQWKGRNNIWNK